jgi:hypothetical protein
LKFPSKIDYATGGIWLNIILEPVPNENKFKEIRLRFLQQSRVMVSGRVLAPKNTVADSPGCY